MRFARHHFHLAGQRWIAARRLEHLAHPAPGEVDRLRGVRVANGHQPGGLFVQGTPIRIGLVHAAIAIGVQCRLIGGRKVLGGDRVIGGADIVGAWVGHGGFLGEVHQFVRGKAPLVGEFGARGRQQPERLRHARGFLAQHLLVQFQERSQIRKVARQEIGNATERKAKALERDNLMQTSDLLGAIDPPARRRAFRPHQAVPLIHPQGLAAHPKAAGGVCGTEIRLGLRHGVPFIERIALSGLPQGPVQGESASATRTASISLSSRKRSLVLRRRRERSAIHCKIQSKLKHFEIMRA
ncbi:hypothetical protein D9M73_133210 [compost metagenome]